MVTLTDNTFRFSGVSQLHFVNYSSSVYIQAFSGKRQIQLFLQDERMKRDNITRGMNIREKGHLGGSGVERLPSAQGTIPGSQEEPCIRFSAGHLLLPLPVSLPLCFS